MPKRILVIDDEEGIRKSFILAFEDTPFEVKTAESGKKGIAMARRRNYDLIFLDLKMPGLNGVETLKQLRKINDKIPIFIVTAFHQEFLEQLNQARDEQLDFELLRKPIDGAMLLAIVMATFEGPTRY